MEATKQQIANIFNGHRILEVPFYQRSYVWQKEQWSRFLEDMIFISHCKQDYFLGSVILKQQLTDMGESNDRRTIIDGQQRFTTLAIFAKVLCLKTDDMDTFNQHFTVRNKKLKTKRYALVHSLNDRKDFEHVLDMQDDEPINTSMPSNIISAYNYFQSHIDENKLDIDTLLAHIVFIAIELQQQDDEQVIFDTINSLGVRLTTAELLKNYFFTEASQDEYEELWMPIFEKNREVANYWDSQVTAGRTKRSNIDAFFSAFLNIKIQDPNIGVDFEHKEIYRRVDTIFSNYKDLISTYNLNKKDFFWEILTYAEVYQRHINPDIAKCELPGKPCFERINFLMYVLDNSTILPYALYVLKNVSSEKERNNIFGYLESYIVRRLICKSDNNSYSDLFSQSLIGNKILTFEAIKEFIENRGEDQALSLPNDERVLECIHEFEHPNKRGLGILYLMETRLRVGKPHATRLYPFDDYSLEHLMPKKFEKNWPLIEGYDEETRKMMINTLGNMSLLPSRLNSSISNAAWDVKKNGNKKQMGLANYASDLVTLKDVIKLKEWNEESICKRADWLGEISVKIWPSYLPGYDDDIDIEFEFDNITDKVSEEPSPEIVKKRNMKQDKTKISFGDNVFLSKAEFVCMFVRKYMEKYPGQSYKQLKSKFPDRLCATGYKFKGLLCTAEDYDAWDNKYKERRYMPNNPNHRLISSDGIVFYVNTQWTLDSVKVFIKMAKDEGWVIETKNKL